MVSRTLFFRNLFVEKSNNLREKNTKFDKKRRKSLQFFTKSCHIFAKVFVRWKSYEAGRSTWPSSRQQDRFKMFYSILYLCDCNFLYSRCSPFDAYRNKRKLINQSINSISLFQFQLWFSLQKSLESI